MGHQVQARHHLQPPTGQLMQCVCVCVCVCWVGLGDGVRAYSLLPDTFRAYVKRTTGQKWRLPIKCIEFSSFDVITCIEWQGVYIVIFFKLLF